MHIVCSAVGHAHAEKTPVHVYMLFHFYLGVGGGPNRVIEMACFDANVQ